MIDRDKARTIIFKILADLRTCSPKKINEDADLYGDLRIWGDDADDLFNELSHQIEGPSDAVDISGCFPGEPHLFNPLPTLFFKPKIRIRVRHLIDAACTKKWPELEKV